MNKLPLLTLFLLLTFSAYKATTIWGNDTKAQAKKTNSSTSKHYSLYEELDLTKKISYQAFEQAMDGFEKIKKQKQILTLIDFSKPSTDERFYVIDIQKKKILYQSVVAHGKNSGENYTTSFSNTPGSNQSSLGFFLTEKSYQGKNGLSLVLQGLEQGINDNAKKRAIVIHGANYANPQLAKTTGRLGRSWGCPALPHELNQSVIETIKEGSVIYAYSKLFNEDYLNNSCILAKGKPKTKTK